MGVFNARFSSTRKFEAAGKRRRTAIYWLAMSGLAGTVDVLCKNCGTTFSAFLQHMAEHNQKVVCPKCGQTHSFNRPDVQKPESAKPKR
jgi:ribosomal protein S27AE